MKKVVRGNEMRVKRDRLIYVILILMGLVSLLSLAFAGVAGMMYKQEMDEVVEVMSQNEQMEEKMLSLTQENLLTEDEVDVLLAQKETDVQTSMKEKMKELVISKDGGPLTMLRYFFPENLIFYDEGNYEFIAISNVLKKHTLVSENFKTQESGEIIYEQNGTVLSHKGIDVSKYQGKIDWKAVKEDGVEYAFIRLGLRGYGSGEIVLDDYYAQNMQGAANAGVATGVYFFTQAITEEEAKEEADFVIEQLKGYEIGCPVVFDVEMITNGNGRANTLSKEERTNICLTFCETIKEAGYIPMIYGNIKCFTKMLDMEKLENYEKWYAFYDQYMYFPYEVSVWQYTESGSVKGIEGKVDMNISFRLWQ